MTIPSLSGISSMDEFPYGEVGLKIGLEIHKQMDGTKLFCRCPVGLSENVVGSVERKLMARGSELGGVDDAASLEWKKRNTIIYELTPNTCPVDIDEEPPHIPGPDIMERALLICLMFHCDTVDRVQFMRKIVIDGSNPSGFQRTGMLGIEGYVTLENGSHLPITSICLEEDAGRRIPDPDDNPRYRLDRAGTPEIEISTDPSIIGPKEAVTAAKRIGELLRSTGFFRRGIGTIRQDVNISILNGPRVEVKLVQDLPTIAKVVRFETARQLLLIEVADELKKRGLNPSNIGPEFVDLTELFKSTSCKVISIGLSRGESVLGIALYGFAGLMGERTLVHPDNEGSYSRTPLSGFDDIRRLGPEFAGYVRSSTGLKGLFHSDELPGYGITGSEVSMIRSSLSLISPLDGFVLICSDPEKAKKALSAVIYRAKSAFQGVVPEVRKALQDGRTEFMRPISGAARMYPETDIPPFHVQDRLLEVLRAKIPEDPTVRIERVSSDNQISRESAIQLNNADQIDRYEHLVRSGSDRKVLAHILLKGHEILGEDLDIVPDRIISWLSLRSANGSIPKESIPDLLETAFGQVRSGMDINTIENGLEERFVSSALISKELEDAIEGIIVQKKDFILGRKGSSVGPLMGILMNEFRGRLDGAIIEKELRTRIEKLLEGK